MYFDDKVVVARWPIGSGVRENWGDKLNLPLINHLSGLPVAHVDYVSGWDDRPVYRVIGSGLGKAMPTDIVWGMGFIDATTVPSCAPAMICAVRGPHSRARLLALGMNCPEIYGDPALLYPLIFSPSVVQEYDIGIILHFRERGVVSPPTPPKGARVRYIDICGSIETVAEEILSCKKIVSSSLHGIICAHSYGIEAFWLKMSDLPLGDDFKFKDYFASIGHEDLKPLTLSADGSFEIENRAGYILRNRVKFSDLLRSCPFIPASRKREWTKIHEQMTRAGRRGVIFDAQ